MNRRKFFKQSVWASLIGSLGQVDRMILLPNGLSEAQWTKVIDIARWAPSVHNLQAQKVKIVSKNQLRIYYDSSRLLPIGDPSGVFTRVALGIFIEHLSIAVSTYGYKIKIDHLVEKFDIKSEGLIRYADLVLENNRNDTISPDLILKRRTSRIPYNGENVKRSTLKKLHKEALKFNHFFGCSSNNELVEYIKDINQKALFQDLNNDDLRKELDNLFRYDAKLAKEKKDGLSAECMGFKGKLLKSVFRNHKRWTKGIRAKLLKNNYIGAFNGTATVGWLKGDFISTQDFTNAGRLMARLWLLVTEDDAYIQPFGSLITNKDSYQLLNNALKVDGNKEELWLVFRIGYSKLPARSERLPVEEIII